jgi:hypothetical protein
MTAPEMSPTVRRLVVVKMKVERKVALMHHSKKKKKMH